MHLPYLCSGKFFDSIIGSYMICRLSGHRYHLAPIAGRIRDGLRSNLMNFETDFFGKIS